MEEYKDPILLVEDDDDTRTILSRLLAKNGFEVRSAIHGEQALELLSEFSPKVIIADWMMPVMDGLQLCDILKNEEKYKGIYFIILTARSTLKDKIAGLDVGADDFLVKPVENQELIARIKSGIRIFNLQTELKSIEQSKAVVNLACTIGHQINNPLSSLIMAAKSIEDEVFEINKEQFEDDVFVMNESINRIKKFVEYLQKIDKPEFIEYALENKMLKID